MFVTNLLPGLCCHTCQVCVSVYSHTILTCMSVVRPDTIWVVPLTIDVANITSKLQAVAFLIELGPYHGGSKEDEQQYQHDATELSRCTATTQLYGLVLHYHQIQGDVVEPLNAVSAWVEPSNNVSAGKMPGTMGWLQNGLEVPPTSPTLPILPTLPTSPTSTHRLEIVSKRKPGRGGVISLYIYPSSFIRIIVMFVSTLLPGVCHHSCLVFVSIYNRAIVTLHFSS